MTDAPDPRDESDARRLAELEAMIRAQVWRLLQLHRGGEVLVRVRVEGGGRPRVSRDSTVTVTEYPLCPDSGHSKPRK